MSEIDCAHWFHELDLNYLLMRERQAAESALRAGSYAKQLGSAIVRAGNMESLAGSEMARRIVAERKRRDGAGQENRTPVISLEG